MSQQKNKQNLKILQQTKHNRICHNSFTVTENKDVFTCSVFAGYLFMNILVYYFALKYFILSLYEAQLIHALCVSNMTLELYSPYFD